MQVLEYQTAAFRKPFSEWIDGLNDYLGVSVISKRINRMRLGDFGDHRSVGDGVWELRVFLGPGYRVYYLLDGRTLILLLCGGDKDSQSRDIARAQEFADDYRRRR